MCSEMANYVWKLADGCPVISNCDTVYGATVYWYVGILVDAVERWSSDKVKKL